MKNLLKFLSKAHFLLVFLAVSIQLMAVEFDISNRSPDPEHRLVTFTKDNRSYPSSPQPESVMELSSSHGVSCEAPPTIALGPSCTQGVSHDIPLKMKVALYCESGVMNKSLDFWEFAIKKIDSDAEIIPVYAEDIKSDVLKAREFSLFVLPGGQASAYKEDLDERAIGKLNQFLKTGGRCLAVGGGAYFLSLNYTFKSPIASSVPIQKNGVGLCNAVAHGPFSPYGNEKLDDAGRKIFPVILKGQTVNNTPLKAFSYCGCSFGESDVLDILARAQKTHSPVIVGEDGRIVLSGVHPEFNSFMTFPTGSNRCDECVDEDATTILRHIFRYLEIPS